MPCNRKKKLKKYLLTARCISCGSAVGRRERMGEGEVVCRGPKSRANRLAFEWQINFVISFKTEVFLSWQGAILACHFPLIDSQSHFHEVILWRRRFRVHTPSWDLRACIYHHRVTSQQGARPVPCCSAQQLRQGSWAPSVSAFAISDIHVNLCLMICLAV